MVIIACQYRLINLTFDLIALLRQVPIVKSKQGIYLARYLSEVASSCGGLIHHNHHLRFNYVSTLLSPGLVRHCRQKGNPDIYPAEWGRLSNHQVTRSGREFKAFDTYANIVPHAAYQLPALASSFAGEKFVSSSFADKKTVCIGCVNSL